LEARLKQHIIFYHKTKEMARIGFICEQSPQALLSAANTPIFFGRLKKKVVNPI